MKVLTRYLLRSHLGPLLFAFVALTGVVLINTIAKELAGLAGKGLPARVFLEFFLLSLPANVALTLPMAVLVAVLYTFSSMAAENEVTALKSSGVDLRRMVLPLLLVAAMIAGGMLWFNNNVLPASNYRWRMLMMDVAQTTPLLTLKPHVVNPIATSSGAASYYLKAERIDGATSRLWDVTIYDLSSADVSRTIYADSGRMVWNPQKTDLVLQLHSGQMREAKTYEPENFQQVKFQQQMIRMAGVAQRLERTAETSYRTDRDMTVGMMRARMDTLRSEYGAVRATANKPLPPSAGVPAEVDVKGQDVPYAVARAQSILFQIREYEVEIQKKYSIAAATLVFVLIGVPLALRFSRGGIGMVIAVSLSIFSIYYVGLIGGEALANEGYVPPWMAMWLTNTVFGVLGLIGLWRAGREQSSGRGGGWGELPRWMRLPSMRRVGRAVEA